MKLKIKVNDEVVITAGKDKGKKGLVLNLNKKALKIRVKDVRLQTKFDKKEGIKKIEGFIDYSNVKLIKSAEKMPAKKQPPKKSAGFFK